jgi:hypothetical protein
MNPCQKEKQKTRTNTTRISKLSFALLTSALLVLSSIAAIQLRTNNAYAQDTDGYSITSLVCELDETRGEFGTYVVTATFDAAGPSTIQFSSGVTTFQEVGGQGLTAGDPDAHTLGSSEDTAVVTANLYEGIWLDTPPEDALRDTATVTCEPTDPTPLEVQLAINPTGTANSREGEVTVSGTVECSQDSEFQISGEVNQRAGRATITGFISEPISCTGGEEPTEWTATVQGDNGRFVAGRATVTVTADCDCNVDKVSTTVRLRGS